MQIRGDPKPENKKERKGSDGTILLLKLQNKVLG